MLHLPGLFYFYRLIKSLNMLAKDNFKSLLFSVFHIYFCREQLSYSQLTSSDSLL